MWDALLTIMMAPLTFIFVLRLNVGWGIPDLFMIVFSEVVGDILSSCFIFLPMNSIMGRICPKHIEATTFALLASTSNFRHYTRSTIGSYINENYVGVTEKDLSKYYILVTISTVCSLLPLLLIKLIPTRA